MKIVVCVKQVPATGEQRLDPVTGTVIREGVASILNPFDAYALEEAENPPDFRVDRSPPEITGR